MSKVLLGYQADTAHTNNKKEVWMDFDQLVNPHAMITGDTGTGKTHTLRTAIDWVIRTSKTPVRVHIFDVHGDIDIDPEFCSTVLFSQSSPYGLNPLLVNPDPDFGGVRRCIQTFINTLRLSPDTSRALGPKQQDVLRNLLNDVFLSHGFDADFPETWRAENLPPPRGLIPGRTYLELPFGEKDLAKNVCRNTGVQIDWDKDARCWHVDKYEGPITQWRTKQWSKTNPTLNSLLQYATRRREMSFTGMGQKEAALMEVVHRKARAMSVRLQQHAKAHNNAVDTSDAEQAVKDLEKAKGESLAAFKDYLATVEHGGALDALLKYDSFDSLSTVKQILETLNSSGLFRDTPPDFDPDKPVWRYVIKPLNAEMQKFMVNVRLTELFNRAVQRGESSDVTEILVIDEGAKFVEDDKDHIINVIALQARKFGQGMWLASQSPTQYSEELRSSVATKVVLGLDPTFWPMAQRQLRIEEKAIKWVRPREGLLANFKLKGQSAQPWMWVTTPAAVNGGRR